MIPLGRVAILGTGQIGTMVGMALRAAPDHAVAEVAVWDRDPAAMEACLRRAGSDRLLKGPEEALDSDLIILATPVAQIVGLVRELGPRLAPGQLLVDTGSSKLEVVRAMQRSVPERAGAVGGHPLCGSSEPGPWSADPALLKGATFVICPVRADPLALGTARRLVETLGSIALELDAGEHDRLLARSSHLPHLVAAALAEMSGDVPTRALFSSGLRGAVRLARSDPAMVASFVRANLEEVRAASRELSWQLDRLLMAADAGEEQLVAELERARLRARQVGVN
ncbi:MAG: prephenate dehydrogenase [Candidatus Dormibacteria bacterium]